MRKQDWEEGTKDMKRKTLAKMLGEVEEARQDVEYVSGYTRPYEPALFRCKTCGYEWRVSPYCIIHGRQCPDCKRQERVTKGRKMHIDMPDSLKDAVASKPVSAEDMDLGNPYIQEIFTENPGFYFLGNPKCWSDDVTAVCRKCGTRMTYTATYFRTVTSCALCGRKIGTSMLECLILAAFRSKAGENKVLHRDRSVIGMELDIYLPEFRFAVEPGGWSFHKDKIRQERDTEKQELCMEHGIRLFTIFDSYNDQADISTDTIWTYDFCLVQEQGLSTLKDVINRLLNEAGLPQVQSSEWKELIAQAQQTAGGITQNEFEARVKDRNADYEVTGQYVNKNTPVEVLCHKHGIRFSAVPYTLYNGGGCPECYKERTRLSNETFLQRVREVNPTIEVLDAYDGTAESVRCRCTIDGYEWSANAGMLMAGHGCPACAIRNRSASLQCTEEDIIIRLQRERPDITYIDGYINTHSKVQIQCNACGHIWKVTPHNLLEVKSKCPACAKKSRVISHMLSEDEFKQKIGELYPGYKVVSTYTGYYDSVTIECPKGHRHTLQAATCLNKHALGSCPECRKLQPRDDIDAETLRYEYLTEGLTIAQIAERHNRSQIYVNKHLDDYGIPKRAAHRAVAVDKDALIRMYVDEKRPVTKIASFFGCSRRTLYKYMHEYGIEERRKR